MKKIIVHSMLVLVAVSVFFRGLFFNYEAYAFLAALSLLSFLYYFIKIRNKESMRLNKLYLVLGMILISANILGFINAVNPRENLGSVLMYTIYVIIFHVLFDYFYDRKQYFIKEIMLSVVLAGFVCAIAGLEALTGCFSFLKTTLYENRLGSAFCYPNTASIYFSLCTLFSLTFAMNAKNPIFKALSIGAGNIFIIAALLTGSRGGYLAGMAILLLLLILQPDGYKIRGILNLVCMLIPLSVSINGFNRGVSNQDFMGSTKWLAISFIAASILFLLFYLIDRFISKSILKNEPLVFPKRFGIIFFSSFAVVIVIILLFKDRFISLLPPILSSRFENMTINDPNILYRLEFDNVAIKLIMKNWLFGLGGGSWLATYQSMQNSFYTANPVHNNYLQVFMESGILGFVSYCGFVIYTLINAVISYIHAKDKKLKIYTAGMLCGFIGLALHSAYDFDLTFVSVAFLFWAMFAALSVRPEADVNETADSNEPKSAKEISITVRQNMYVIIPVTICAILFSMYALFFTGAYNANEGQKYDKANNLQSAMLYYEEANRFDPNNADYLFELSKIYDYFAVKSENNAERDVWLKKAISTGEKSINGNKYYPPQLKTLIRLYREANLPLKALEYSQKLVVYQRYNSTNYQILADTYLDAAKYYIEKNDAKSAKELLKECIAIKENPYLLNSNATISDAATKTVKAKYIPNGELVASISEATEIIKN